MEAFRRLEDSVIEKVDCANTVIATGGSAVYCTGAMEHLKSIGQIVFLNLPLSEIETRIGDPAARGVVMGEGYDPQRSLRRAAAPCIRNMPK